MSLTSRISLTMCHQGSVRYVKWTLRGMQPARLVSFQPWNTCVYPLIVHRGLVAPSSRWSLRSPADISSAGFNHFSRLSLSEVCLGVRVELTLINVQKVPGSWFGLHPSFEPSVDTGGWIAEPSLMTLLETDARHLLCTGHLITVRVPLVCQAKPWLRGGSLTPSTFRLGYGQLYMTLVTGTSNMNILHSLLIRIQTLLGMMHVQCIRNMDILHSLLITRHDV